MQFARQGGGQIETEPVHVHLQNPVPQGIHDELQHVGVAHIQTVAGAGVIHVIALIFGKAVIIGIIDSLETEHRTEMVAFCRMVVDDIQNNFDVGLVQRLDHLLEFSHGRARDACRRHIHYEARNNRWNYSPSSFASLDPPGVYRG